MSGVRTVTDTFFCLLYLHFSFFRRQENAREIHDVEYTEEKNKYRETALTEVSSNELNLLFQNYSALLQSVINAAHVKQV